MFLGGARGENEQLRAECRRLYAENKERIAECERLRVENEQLRVCLSQSEERRTKQWGNLLEYDGKRQADNLAGRRADEA